jgi:hypothetical protein
MCTDTSEEWMDAKSHDVMEIEGYIASASR